MGKVCSALGVNLALKQSTAPVSMCPLAAPGVTHSKSDGETKTNVHDFEDKYSTPHVDAARVLKQCNPAQSQFKNLLVIHCSVWNHLVKRKGHELKTQQLHFFES